MKILLAKVMVERNITFEQLSRRSGISKSTLHRIASKQTSPTMDNMEKLAMGLGINIVDLFESKYK